MITVSASDSICPDSLMSDNCGTRSDRFDPSRFSDAIEMTGTYPLPEAQLDRFFSRISLGYPSKDDEMAILSSQQVSHPLEFVKSVINTSELLDLQIAVRDVFVHDSVREYIIEVVRATREHNMLLMGSSPRGALHLMRASQGMAAMRGSEFVRPDDVKEVAPSILGHRVIGRAELRARGTTTDQVIENMLADVPAPVPVS